MKYTCIIFFTHVDKVHVIGNREVIQYFVFMLCVFNFTSVLLLELWVSSLKNETFYLLPLTNPSVNVSVIIFCNATQSINRSHRLIFNLPSLFLNFCHTD